MLNSAFVVLAASLALSLILTATVRKFAIRYGYVAHPQKN